MTTVGAIMNNLENILEKSKVYIDFSEVEQVDSAAVALFIYITKFASENPHKVRWSSLPPSIFQCADIYELEGYFASAGYNNL